MSGRLTNTEKENLIALAEKMIFITPDQQPIWVLAAKWDDKWRGYKPFLTSFSHFDHDPNAILLKAHFKPLVRDIEMPQVVGHKSSKLSDAEISKLFQAKPKKTIGAEKEAIYLRATKKTFIKKTDKPFEWPTDLDQVTGWSLDKENELNASLRAQGLFKPESEPMLPEISDFRQGYQRAVSESVQKIVDAISDETKLRHPDSDEHKILQRFFDFKNIFNSLSGTVVLNQFMMNPPLDLKQSILQELVESDALGAMPFKTKATAYLLSKNLRNAEAAVDIFLNECLGFKALPESKRQQCKDLFSNEDFYTHQSILEALLQKIIASSNVWGKFYQVMNELTAKQKKVIELLYLAETPKTYLEASRLLEISVDSVRDREAGAIQKLRKAFPEFKDFYPYKDWSKNQKRYYTYDGMVYTPLRDLIHSLYRIKKSGSLELYEWIGGAKPKSRIVEGSRKIIREFIDQNHKENNESSDAG